MSEVRIKYFAEERQCEMCKQYHDLDLGFLNIAEICDGTDQRMDAYEKKHKVDLTNYWCAECGSKALKQIEENA